MRVLLITHQWSPDTGVPQARWNWLSEELMGLGHEFTVLTPRAQGKSSIDLVEKLSKTGPEVEPNLKIEYTARIGQGHDLLSKMFGQLLVSLLSLFKALRLYSFERVTKPHLVIGTVPALPTALSTYVIARLINRPYVIDLRDAWPDLLDNSATWDDSVQSQGRVKAIFLNAFIKYTKEVARSVFKRCLRKSAGIMVTSRRLKCHILEDFQKDDGFTKQDIVVVRNVFPREVVGTRREKCRADISSDRPLRILYAGTIGRAQGLSNVIDAISICKEQGIDIEFRLRGDGASRTALLAKAKRLGIDTDYRKVSDMCALREDYNWADTALVHLENWKALEMAVPSKLYELLELGMHVTAVASGETAEIIQSLKAGHVADPGSPESLAQLLELLSRNRGELTVGQYGASWVQTSRKQTIGKELLSFLDRAIDSNGARS